MADTFGDILPLAIGIAISPVPIIAVILMLFSNRARSNGPAFLVGWVRHRPKAGDQAAMPKWMATIDGFTPVKADHASARSPLPRPTAASRVLTPSLR